MSDPQEIAALTVIRDRVVVDPVLLGKIQRAQLDDAGEIVVSLAEWDRLVELMTTPRTVEALGEGPYALTIGGRPVRKGG